MKQKLPRDILTLFVFWFGVGYLYSRFPVSFLPLTLEGVGLIWVVGGCAGLSIAWCVHRSGFHFVRAGLAAGQRRDANATATIMDGGPAHTLHRVALPRPPEPAKGRIRGNPMQGCEWWPEFIELHPRYAKVMRDVFAVMQTRPGLPAGIDGHQDATLVEHSLDVVRQMLDLAPAWEYQAPADQSRSETQSATEPGVRLFGAGVLHHPILPLVAFAHDLGKVECLVEKDDGMRMLPGHCQRGAELLRRLPSVAALPMDDRDGLLLAVKYYHHLSDMPLSGWISDRTRSLTGLLHEADVRSSYNLARNAEPAPVVAAQPAAADGDQILPETAHPQLPGQGAGLYVMDDGATPLDVLVEILSEHKRVNGTSRASRVAWKYGVWAYVEANALKALASAKVGDPSIADDAGNKHPFLVTLLNALAEHGWLYRGNPARQPTAAVWTAASSSEGAADHSRKYPAIVIATEVTPYLQSAEDCPYPPVLLDPDAGALTPPGASPSGLTETQTVAEREDTQCYEISYDVARQLNTEEKKSARRGTLTKDVILQLCTSTLPLYGMRRVTMKGKKLLVFDVSDLQRDFLLDETNPPVGASVHRSKRDGKMKLVVIEP